MLSLRLVWPNSSRDWPLRRGSKSLAGRPLWKLESGSYILTRPTAGIDAWIGRPLSNKVFNDPSHADFWRASPSGQLYIIRGYWEDGVEWASTPQRNSGAILTVNISVIRIWECLRFASRFMRAFGDIEEVVVRCQYTGLPSRTLIDSLEPAFSIRRGVSQVDEVLLTGQFTLQQLEDNMPEVLRQLMVPLFEHFDFFQLTVAHVQNIIDRYREKWPW